MSSFFFQDQDEELLNYDDSAAYYFGATVLSCVVIPWTWVWIRYWVWGAKVGHFPERTVKGRTPIRYCRNNLTESNLRSIEAVQAKADTKYRRWNVFKLVSLGFLWVTWLYCFMQLADDSSANAIKGFNPYDVLGLEPGADDNAVKRAYRKMSLQYHPDKNPDDPLASAKFMQVSQALKCLTDAVAKENWEKYGNPDGPQTTKVGIGLPRFLLEKQNHLLILCVFFAAFLIVIPAIFIVYYQRQKDYSSTGVLVETLQFMGHYINESTRVKNCPELLASSAESRQGEIRPEDDMEMKPLIAEVVLHQKPKFTLPIIVRNNYLLWAHMQRLHHLMSPNLRLELDELLRHIDKITTAMIEIASVREWFETSKSVIDFKRSMIQALDIKSSSLLQIPHFTDETIKHCNRGNNPLKDVQAFLAREPSQRRGVAHMSESQLLDVDEFCKHMTQVDVEAVAAVDGEKSICKDDIATITVKVTRTNLSDGMALGYVHAPLFPELKHEEWYIFLTENNKVICWEKVRNQERTFVEKLRFHVGRKGKHNLQVFCMCDSYSGIDQTVKVEFDALNPDDDPDRAVYVHPEDEELDNHPTLFQQFVGELGNGDESEDEEAEEVADKSKDNNKAKGGDDSGGSSSDSESSDSDSDSDSEDKKKK